VPLQQRDLLVKMNNTMNISLNGWVSKSVAKQLLKMLFLTEDKDLIGWIHWSIKSVRDLCWTLLIFAIGWAVCGQPQLGHESMMPYSLLSVNPLKVCPVSRNILRKLFASQFLFIYEHLHKYLIFNTKFCCCNGILA